MERELNGRRSVLETGATDGTRRSDHLIKLLFTIVGAICGIAFFKYKHREVSKYHDDNDHDEDETRCDSFSDHNFEQDGPVTWFTPSGFMLRCRTKSTTSEIIPTTTLIDETLQYNPSTESFHTGKCNLNSKIIVDENNNNNQRTIICPGFPFGWSDEFVSSSYTFDESTKKFAAADICDGVADDTLRSIDKIQFLRYCTRKRLNVVQERNRLIGDVYARCSKGMIAELNSCGTNSDFIAESGCVERGECDGRPDGFIIDPPTIEISKEEWTQCEDGKVVVKRCPNGFVWNAIWRRCDDVRNPCSGLANGTMLPIEGGERDDEYWECVNETPTRRRCTDDAIFLGGKCRHQMCVSDPNTLLPVRRIANGIEFKNSDQYYECVEDVLVLHSVQRGKEHFADTDNVVYKLHSIILGEKDYTPALELGIPFYRVFDIDEPNLSRELDIDKDIELPLTVAVSKRGGGFCPQLDPHNITVGRITFDGQNNRTFVYNTVEKVYTLEGKIVRGSAPMIQLRDPMQHTLIEENDEERSVYIATYSGEQKENWFMNFVSDTGRVREFYEPGFVWDSEKQQVRFRKNTLLSYPETCPFDVDMERCYFSLTNIPPIALDTTTLVLMLDVETVALFENRIITYTYRLRNDENVMHKEVPIIFERDPILIPPFLVKFSAEHEENAPDQIPQQRERKEQDDVIDDNNDDDQESVYGFRYIDEEGTNQITITFDDTINMDWVGNKIKIPLKYSFRSEKLCDKVNEKYDVWTGACEENIPANLLRLHSFLFYNQYLDEKGKLQFSDRPILYDSIRFGELRVSSNEGVDDIVDAPVFKSIENLLDTDRITNPQHIYHSFILPTIEYIKQHGTIYVPPSSPTPTPSPPADDEDNADDDDDEQPLDSDNIEEEEQENQEEDQDVDLETIKRKRRF